MWCQIHCRAAEGISPLKMCFNCTNNLTSDHAAVIWGKHFICAVNLTKSVHKIASQSSFIFWFFFSVPSQAADLWLCFHTLLLPQLTALTLFTYSSGRQVQSPLKGEKKCSSWINKELGFDFFMDRNLHLSTSKFQLVCLKTLLQPVMCAVCLGYPEKKRRQQWWRRERDRNPYSIKCILLYL